MNLMNFVKSELKKNVSPQVIVNRIAPNIQNPILQDLIKQANNNNFEQVEKFGNNVFSQNGRNFSQEYQNFRNFFK